MQGYQLTAADAELAYSHLFLNIATSEIKL